MYFSKRSIVKSSKVVVAAALTLAVCLPIGHEWRHETLNRKLIAAIRRCDPQSVTTLLNAGADPNARSAPPRTVQQMFSDLLHHAPTASNSDTALLIAVDSQNTHSVPTGSTARIVSALVRKGADVNAVGEFNAPPLLVLFWRWSLPEAPDLLATPRENVEVVSTLLDARANIEAKDINGFTPLMNATNDDFVASVRLLLRRGANPNVVAPDCSPDTALGLASDNTAVKKLLREYGARR